MRMIELSSGLATGGAGVATNNQNSSTRVEGLLAGIVLEYGDSPPATTDILIATAGTLMPAFTILDLDNANTNGLFLPGKQVITPAGVAITDLLSNFAIFDFVNVKIEQANDNDYLKAYLLLQD